MTDDDENVVHETIDVGVQPRHFVGATAGLFLQFDTVERRGDYIDADSTADDITTEPKTPGYERITLKNEMNPTFDVDGFVGSLDHLFIVNDDGELLAWFPLRDRNEPVVIHDHMSELTPQIWGDDSGTE